MDDIDLKMRGEKPLSEEDALDAALAEAAPMIAFWSTALVNFGPECRDVVREHFTDALWAVTGNYASNLDVRREIYDELFNCDITETVQ